MLLSLPTLAQFDIGTSGSCNATAQPPVQSVSSDQLLWTFRDVGPTRYLLPVLTIVPASLSNAFCGQTAPGSSYGQFLCGELQLQQLQALTSLLPSTTPPAAISCLGELAADPVAGSMPVRDMCLVSANPCHANPAFVVPGATGLSAPVLRWTQGLQMRRLQARPL